MCVIGSFCPEQVDVISVTGVTTLSERRLKKTTYFNKDTFVTHTQTCGNFHLVKPRYRVLLQLQPDCLASSPTAADGQASGSETIRVERQKSAVLL